MAVQSTVLRMSFTLLLTAATLWLSDGCSTSTSPEPIAQDQAAGESGDDSQGVWTLGQRSLPPPAGASEALRGAIARARQREVGDQEQQTLDWVELRSSSDAGNAQMAVGLSERWGIDITEDEVAGVTVRRVTPGEIHPANRNRLFVHVHGGAYVLGGGPGSAFEGLLIAHFAQIPVLSIDYSMPPEHPFPASIDDVVAVWKSLLEERPAKSMVLGGTSAGGGLALASTHRFIELGLDTPGAIWAGTPWADLSKTGDSLFVNEGVDRMVVSYQGILEEAAKLYADGRDLKNPLISPVYGDFEGFPPTYLVTGTRDLFLSDVVRVHRKLRVANVPAELNVYEGLSHGEYFMNAPERDQVFGELSAFLLKHLQ